MPQLSFWPLMHGAKENGKNKYDLLKTTAQNGRLLIYLCIDHWTGFNSIQWMLLIHNI